MSGQTDKFERCQLYLQSKHRGHANRCPLCANSGHSGLLPKQIGRLAAAYRKFDQRQRADRYNNIGPPKSDSSVRTIPLDREAMVPALKEWKLKCPPSDFVFPTSTGRIEHHANMLRGLEPIMVKSGVIEKGGPKYALHLSAISSPAGASIQRRVAVGNCRPSRCPTRALHHIHDV